MAISLVDSVILSAWATATRSPVMTLPTGLSVNDYIVYSLATESAHAVSTPTNHDDFGTQNFGSGSDGSATLLGKQIDGTEGASITLTNVFAADGESGPRCRFME